MRFLSALLYHPQTQPQVGLAVCYGTRPQWEWEQTGCAGAQRQELRMLRMLRDIPTAPVDSLHEAIRAGIFSVLCI